jgi:hypothetical protein
LAGKDEKRKKRPVVTPSPKIPAPKRIPGGRPTQPKYEKPRQPEGTTGPAPSKIEPPTAKPGKGPDRSLSGHWVELGEKKEEKTPAKPQVRVISKKLTVGIVVALSPPEALRAYFRAWGFLVAEVVEALRPGQ